MTAPGIFKKVSLLTLPAFEAGWVWLAGAGPGDPGLLTLHALNALEQADVVVHDALVDARVLTLAGSGARLIHAGKRGGRPSAKQIDITRRIIAFARNGHRVLRLKGGDPFTFGRGSEEALALAAAGIPFRVIPGITSGLGGLAYAGIPATDRGIAQAVTFVTGHTAGGDIPDTVDWDAVARAGGTIVVYMGAKHLGKIAARLIAGGRSPREPVAIISRATLPDQSVIETTLAQAGEDAVGAPTPAIIAVGEAVRLRAGMDWLGAIGGRVLDPYPTGARADLKTA